MTSTNDIPRQRVIQLDILRGVAILLVIFRHSVAEYTRSRTLEPIFKFLHHFGWTGVDLFFVLSGFLIGGLLFKEIEARSRLDVKRFLIRRGFKIWPSYLLLVAVVGIEEIWQHGAMRGFKTILPNLLHLQNYLGSPRGFTWSLAVEEHFYLALPLFLLVVMRGGMPALRGATIPIAVGVVAIACLVMRLRTPAVPFNEQDMHWYTTHLWPTHLRIDSLFFGVLLAYLFHIHPQIMDKIGRQRGLLLLIGLALLAPVAAMDDHGRFVRTYGYTMLYLGYGCILLAMIYTTPGRGISGRLIDSFFAKGLAFIGVYSYTMYLWQAEFGIMPVRHFALPWAKSHLHSGLFGFYLMGLQILLTFIGGVVMAKIIERPALALRDRLFPGRASAPATHSPTTEAPALLEPAAVAAIFTHPMRESIL